MKKLIQIKTEIDGLKAHHNAMTEVLKENAYLIFSKSLKKKAKLILKLVSEVESSRELTTVENDEWYCQYLRVDLSKIINTEDSFQRELFFQYMSREYCVYVDFKNDCFLYSIGPTILINDENEVLDQDSGKWIISKKDFETETELKEKIEKYMENKGYFPSVIKCDRYGNAHYFDTKN